MPENKMNHCHKCHKEVNTPYCADCGQAIKLERISGKYILSEIGSIVNLEKGIFYTIKELIIRPGKNIQGFINEDRNRLVKPIMFIIICSLIYTIAQQLFRFEDGYIQFHSNEKPTTLSIFTWIQSNYGYANILMALFIGFWLKVFFKKYNYNFFEILILLCFLMGVGMLTYTLFGITEAITGLKILHYGGILALIYTSWAIASFFDKKKKSNYIKAVLAYILGMISFSLIALSIGLLIDYIR